MVTLYFLLKSNLKSYDPSISHHYPCKSPWSKTIYNHSKLCLFVSITTTSTKQFLNVVIVVVNINGSLIYP